MTSSYQPKIGDIVKLERQKDTFEIVHVDYESQSVDLRRVGDDARLLLPWGVLAPTGYRTT